MGNPYSIVRLGHGLSTEFMQEGACKIEGTRPDIFFADTGRSLEDRFAVQEAKMVCMRCQVQVDCLEYAMAGKEHGVWGGLTTDERTVLRSKRTRQARGTTHAP